MAKFSVSFDDEGNIQSSFGRAWVDHQVPINVGDDILHPCRSIAMGSIKFSNAFNDAVDALIASDLYEGMNKGAFTSLLKAFEDLCYKATEMFDVFTQMIPNAINFRPSSEFKKIAIDYADTIKKRRDDWAFICNKIKHNNNVLFAIRQRCLQSGETISGFALYQPVPPSGMFRNKNFHKGERSRPFDIALRQLVHDIMRCDLAAAETLKKLPQTTSEKDQVRIPTYQIRSKLELLGERRVLAGDHQKTMFDGFVMDNDGVHFNRSHAETMTGSIEIRLNFRGDGFTNQYEFA